MRKSLLFVVIAVLALVVPVAGEAANSCSVTATGLGSGTCLYTATGAGEYKVATASGFRIEIMSPADRKGTLVASGGVQGNPVPGITVRTGDLLTQAGDVVAVSISIGQQTLPNGTVWRYQDGTITAGDKV